MENDVQDVSLLQVPEGTVKAAPVQGTEGVVQDLAEFPSDDMSLLAVRLRIATEKKGVTQAQLARACGVKPPSVNGWITGKSKYLKGNNLLAAARTLDVSQEWLATGEGTMLPYDSGLTIPNLPSNEFVEVPILNTRQSMLDDTLTEHLYEEKIAFRKVDLERLHVSPRYARVLMVGDDCMTPTLRKEGFVLINTEETVPVDTQVYAVFHDGLMFVRRLILDYSDTPGERVWMMRCDHPDRSRYPDRRLPPDAALLGQVVWCAGAL